MTPDGVRESGPAVVLATGHSDESASRGKDGRAEHLTGNEEQMPAGTAPASGAAGFTVRVVAERLGIPTATLRSWTRRYGIGPDQQRPGKHRLYTQADIATLEQMLALIRAGASPAGAAAAVTERPTPPERGHWEPLLTFAFALDARAVSTLITAHLRAYGVLDTWNLLCRPAFAEIVARQLGGEGCIDVEHLLSWAITAALHTYAPPTGSGQPPAAVLACTSGETHALPLEALRAALVERGLDAWMLGADVPTAALSDAVARIDRRPDVMLWSQQESTALTSAVRVCVEAGARVFIGGPGWEQAIAPEAAIPVHTLAEAVERIAGARDRPA